jgi:hypothetical protein
MSDDATADWYHRAPHAIASEIVEEHRSDAGSVAPPAVEVIIEPTGDADVDAALERLAEIQERPTPEHAEVYEDVHRRLQAALADLGAQR